jgi:hypothetical protein
MAPDRRARRPDRHDLPEDAAMNRSPLAVRTAAVAALALACAGPAQAQEWDWVIAPYLWMASIDTDLNEDSPPVENERNYDSVLDQFDGTFQLHAEGQGDRWGLMGDVLWMGLADERDGPIANTRADLDATVWDFAAVWNVEPARYEGLDVFAGIRYIDLSFDVRFDPVDPAFADVEATLDDSYADFLVGARYTAALSERWKLISRVDGSFGDTDGTLNASLMAAWETEDLGSWAFGYRYMNGELGNDDRDIDVTLHGPVVSYAFGFR